MDSEKDGALSAVLVGCGGMGRRHAHVLKSLEEFRLLAVCDAEGEFARSMAADLGVRAFTSFGAALRMGRPDVAAVCTPTDSHADLTVQAAQAGVRAVYCESPMTTNLSDARAMASACEERKAVLVVGNQRRLGADLVKARRIIEGGKLGQVTLVRGNGAGDLLTDGSHMVDSILSLLGDPEPTWAYGQVHRQIDDYAREQAARQRMPTAPGFRNGHPVENGGMGVFEVEGGVRVELFWGDVHEPGRHYQDYEVFGTAGRLWRTDVRFSRNLFVQDAAGGPYAPGWEDEWFKPVPAERGAPGGWRPIEVEWDAELTDLEQAYRLLALSVREGEPHPMSGQVALRGMQVLIGLYESARRRRPVRLPVRQNVFPLELMLRSGGA